MKNGGSRFDAVRHARLVGTAAAVCLCAFAHGAPSFVSAGFSGASDISADGHGVLGILTNPPTPTLVKINFDAPATYLPGPAGGDQSGNPGGVLMGSDDLSVLSRLWYDVENFTGVNCFMGNTVANQAEPCTLRYSPHRYAAGVWSNLGTFPRFQQMTTYANYPQGLNVWVGGTRCDFDTFTVSDVSGNGNVFVGQGYYATAIPNGSGNAPTGICGSQYRAGVWSTASGLFNLLPVQAGTNQSYAYKASFDGSVIAGRDNNHLCVWRNTVQTILDPSGYSSQIAITRDGNTVVSQMSAATAAANGFPSAVTLAKWTWNGSAWVASNIGLPETFVDDLGASHPCVAVWVSGVSDDGNTIIGTALHDSAGFGALQRLFIWRPTINGGVPTDFVRYYKSLRGPTDTSLDGVVFAAAVSTTYFAGCSADGNALLTNFQDQRYPGTGLTFEQGVFHLDDVACQAPRLIQEPIDQSVGNLSNIGIVLNYSVSGTWPLNFQWQVRDELNPGNWIDIIDDHPNVNASGFDFHGANTSKFIIGHLNGPHWGTYRCVVTNGCGTITSADTIVECGTPSVVAPTSKTACEGNDVTFDAQGIGLATMLFQWYKNGSPIFDGASPTGSYYIGTDTSTLTVSGLVAADVGQYSFMATNLCNQSATSGAGTLTVTTAPTLTAQPGTVNARPGDTKYFQVSVSNAELFTFNFQWRRNGVALADGPTGTGSTITGSSTAGYYGSYLYVHTIGPSDAGQYDCIVSGAGCADQTISQAGTLVFVCPADLDDGTQTGTPDGAITIDDLLYFLVAFESGSNAADLDDGTGTGTHDGAVTIDDLLFFLVHFEQGC